MQITLHTKAISPTLSEIQLRAGGVLCATLQLERLVWDSEVLAMPAGRIASLIDGTAAGNMPLGIFSALPAEMVKMGLKYVTIRRPQGEWRCLHALERAGFCLIDVIIEYAKPLSPSKNLSSRDVLRLASPEDVPKIADLAVSTFKMSRFHNDPLLSIEVAERVHREWVKNACIGVAADAVWVVGPESKVSGFVSCKIKDKVGTIDLVAVAREHAGQGMGQSLVALAERWFISQGCVEVRVQTQANNFAAMALYTSCEFKTRSTHNTLRWSPS